MNKRGFMLAVILLIAAINFASAAFVVDSNISTLKKSYSIGDYISGSIAINFSNESADSILTTTVGGTFTIQEWLEIAGKQMDKDYQCSIINCTTSYRTVGYNPSVSISLTEPKTVGFLLSGSNVSVKSISLKAQTSLQESCSKQFSIGVFDTEKYVLENYLSTGNLCGTPKKGCFDSTLDAGQYQLANLTTNEYCERISLSPAPGYKLGASFSGPLGPLKEKVKLRLYNNEFNIIYGTCDLPISGEQQECIIEYPISTESDYNVCIFSNNTNSLYQIKTEQRDQKCGATSATKTSQSTIDFDIWAQPLEYSSSQVSFDYDKFALINFEANWTKVANDYLKQKYSSTCLDTECYLPLKVVGQSQTVSFSDAIVVYESDGVVKTRTQIDEIGTSAGTITSGKLIISLDKLKIPVDKKISILEIKLDGKTVIKSNIEVKSAQIEINPGFALIGTSTKFKITSNFTIKNATWKFSDNPGNIRYGTEVDYSFSTAGEYNVEVTATTSEGTILTRTNNIIVGEPKASAEEIIASTRDSINAVSEQINSMPAWIKTAIESKIDTIKLNASLSAIEAKYVAATLDEDYVSIIEETQTLNVPSAVGTIRIGKFPLLSGYYNINTQYARTLDNIDFTDAQLETALSEWLRDNYDSEMNIDTTGASFPSGTEPILTKIRIVTNPKTESQAQRYLIIDAPFESVHFMEGYSQKEIEGAVYLPLQSGQQVIEFYIDGEAGIETLGAYIMPTFAELREGEYSYEIVGSNREKINKVIYASLSMLIIILIAVTFGLQYWYRNKYEKHLFPKAEELYNIMTFVHNSQKSGLREGDIRKKLLASGWTREQISYALGRLKGRILGLFGLPIYSANQEKKVKEEIETRQRRGK